MSGREYTHEEREQARKLKEEQRTQSATVDVVGKLERKTDELKETLAEARKLLDKLERTG